MAPDATRQRTAAVEPQLPVTLIERYGLDDEALGAISALRREAGLSFGEAAVKLGFIPASPESAGSLRPGERRPRDHALPQAVALRAGPQLPPGIESRAEDIRRLRTELLMRQDDRDISHRVAILSPGAGEGRSQLAAELAIAFSQLGEPTLLVDGDLRHGCQHRLFNASNVQGLGCALSGQDGVQPLAVNGPDPLFLLGAGPPLQDPLERLSDPQFDRLLTDWRQRYRFVVIDTPPVSQYADALVIAYRVGRVLALSRADHTTYRATRELLRRLSATRSRILGAVINRF